MKAKIVVEELEMEETDMFFLFLSPIIDIEHEPISNT